MNKLHSLLESFNGENNTHPNPSLRILTSWCWTGMISGVKNKEGVQAWLTPLGIIARDFFRNISGEIVLPEIKAAYHEKKIAVLFPPATNKIAGVKFYNTFWPQGVQIIECDSKWYINAHGWNEDECENSDGYMGGWFQVAEFDHLPSKQEIEVVISVLNNIK